MPLIYALVSRGKTVLAEYTESVGNFATVTRLLLARMPHEPTRMSYIYNRYVFHYLIRNELTYLVMADRDLCFRVPFAFLEDVAQQFESRYGEDGKMAIALAMNDEFSLTLKSNMHQWNAEGSDEFASVRTKIDDIQNVMIDNIDRILARGEKIELLVDKTEDLNREAFHFRRQAGRLSRQTWWRTKRTQIFIVLLLMTVMWMIITVGCGGFSYDRCRW